MSRKVRKGFMLVDTAVYSLFRRTVVYQALKARRLKKQKLDALRRDLSFPLK
jgi:hypothetical protein